MKKYLILFLPLFFLGCEKEFDNVVEPGLPDYRIIGTNSFPIFFYNQPDSTLKLFLQLDQSSVVSAVYCDIFSSENKKLNTSSILLYDNGNLSNLDTIAGDNIYSNKFDLSINHPDGRYNIRYYVTDLFGKTNLAATQSFTYDNGKNKIPPVLSNLQMPDTVNTNQTFSFSVFVADSNGLNDISAVYYELYRPDGALVTNSQGVSKFPLFDDGQTASNGDLTAGDGRFTVLLTFPVGVTLGSWRFEFTAIDRSNKLSNKIIHFLVVK